MNQSDKVDREPSSGEITKLLRAWSKKDPHALDKLMPLVYDKLRCFASHQLQYEAIGHTLQTTALVNETYLELAKTKAVRFQGRKQFFYFTSHIMRHILVRYARQRFALKRGCGRPKAGLDEKLIISGGHPLALSDLLALHEALDRLAELDAKQCRIVELRFFAGMNDSEIAREMGISRRTVQRHWCMGKIWLCREMARGSH